MPCCLWSLDIRPLSSTLIFLFPWPLLVGLLFAIIMMLPWHVTEIAAMVSMAFGPWGQPLRTLPIDIRHTISLSPFPTSLPAFVLIQSSPSLIPTVGRVGGKDNYFSFIYLYVLNLLHSPKALNIWRPRPRRSSNILFCFGCCPGCCGHCVFVLTLPAWKR